MELPSHLVAVYSKEKIAAAVSRVGAEITPWACSVWKERGQDVVCIPVLRGGLFFFADVVRAIDCSIEVSSARTVAYEARAHAKPLGHVEAQIEKEAVRDRHLLVLDDLCDSGRSLKELVAALLEAGAREVRTAVLITRRQANPCFEPDWTGFHFDGPEWLVGYGMDDKSRFRNLPDVYKIRTPAAT